MKITAKKVTPREKEVLGLLAKGMSYRSIATELGITAETVKKHLKNIYRKLKVSNKIEALIKFWFL
ncbi:MAG: helix-turn-helix transcriptional regulator [Ferruginibacter sp.]|nr:helix-turn-helix transcriptional regulator [Bacteroidota bacterium]MBX2918489.1 helix-turn-helix transcriptional regulator [Ferruginibacter sp.]MCB0710594.1 helix-turn-helix transcriptional regulator [Chitinophagaceae bacterium]